MELHAAATPAVIETHSGVVFFHGGRANWRPWHLAAVIDTTASIERVLDTAMSAITTTRELQHA